MTIATAHTTITPAYIQLNAENPKSLSEFYIENIGLTLIDEDLEHQTYQLGSDKDNLLLEISPATDLNQKKSAGLYHFALLLPNRSDLGEILRSFIAKQVPLQGASDHGYSEAIYLQDPEGNGIEIYWDKPRMEWDIKDNGEIQGVTLAMDAQGVLASAEKPFLKLPTESKMGHFHISIPDLDQSSEFYQTYLGLGKKHTIPDNAVFLASGNYHHHLGTNVWFGRMLEARKPGQKGLGLLAWHANVQDFEYIKSQLETDQIPFTSDENSLTVDDPFGITHKIIKEK